MSPDLPPVPVAAGIVAPTPWTKLLPYLALFVRLAIGLAMLNLGLAAVTASRPNPFGGPGGWSSQGLPPWLSGLGILFDLLPYATLAAGVGLVFGIFTTASALLACGLTLFFPLVLAFELVVTGGTGSGGPMMAFGRSPTSEVLLIFSAVGIAAVPSLVALVLLSPTSINRFSVDALIFQRGAPIVPASPPIPPAAAEIVESTDAGRAGPG